MYWSVLQEKAQEQGLPLSTVVAEVLHLVVLDVIFANPESQSICFQGGTCIHLLHGGYRYSEDLDFAGENITPALSQRLVTKSQSGIEKNVIQLLGQGQCEWRFPSLSKERRIHAFWLNFQQQGKQQKYRVKIEFASYPIYQSKVMTVHSDLDLLKRSPLVGGLTPTELLAEKVTAVAGRTFIKGRDLFDLWYLSEVLGASAETQLVKKKFRDYRISVRIEDLELKLKNYKIAALTAEMKRFLPKRYRQHLQKDDYEVIRQTSLHILKSINDVVD